MTNYRRNFVPGGCQFFTVNLAERESRLLTDRVDSLRAAFRYARARYPFTVEAIVVLPIISTPSGRCRTRMPTTRPAGG
jgi:putative transposase